MWCSGLPEAMKHSRRSLPRKRPQPESWARPDTARSAGCAPRCTTPSRPKPWKPWSTSCANSSARAAEPAQLARESLRFLDGVDGLDDVLRRDAEDVDQLFGFTGVRHAVHGQSLHRRERNPGFGKSGQHGLAQATLVIMVFHGHHASAGGAHIFREGRGVDRLDAIEIDHANGDLARGELVVRLERFEESYARADHRDAVARALSQHLQSGHREFFFSR